MEVDVTASRLSLTAAPTPAVRRGGALFDAAMAEGLAKSLLEDMGTRRAHTQRVADQACRARSLLYEPWRSALVPAAWLHDVGYSDDLAVVGFHPLDGARYLRHLGWPSTVCRLVAWHTTAEHEARLRDLDALLESEFVRPPQLAADVLAWADLTSSPMGERWSLQRRFTEIFARYPPESIVHRAVVASRPELLAAATVVGASVLAGADGRSADVRGGAGPVDPVVDAEALGGVDVEGLDVGDGHPAHLA